jgi:RimJ/RimL family protein N-acetyltransferase
VIFIHCLKTNTKSENVAKRCNFTLQGIAKYYNGHKYEDYYRYSKTVEAFEIEI